MSRSAAAAAILCVGVLLVSAGPLSAQASRLGNTFAVASQGLDSDVAYDSTHGVYLTTWGMWPVRARFVAAGGTPIGDAFQVPSANNAQTPRVAYAPGIDAFLVVWLDERTRDNRVRVWGRLLRFTADGTPQFLSEDIQISQVVAHSANPPNIAYSQTSNEFLVTWTLASPMDVLAQRVSGAGALLGGQISIAQTSYYESQSVIAWNSQLDEFYVAFTAENNDRTAAHYIRGQRIKAGTGDFVGAVNTLYGAANTYFPAVSYNPVTNQCLVISYTLGPAPGFEMDVQGILVNAATGEPASGVMPVAATPSFPEGGDVLGLAYNPMSGTYLAVFMHLDANAGTGDNWGVEVSGTGVSGTEFQVTRVADTGSPVRRGSDSFHPRVTANTQASQWLMVTTPEYARTVTQLVQSGSSGPVTPPPPPPPLPPPPPAAGPIPLDSGSAPNGSWFFSEGVARTDGLGFDTYYQILNPNAETVSVRVYYASTAGGVTRQTFDVGGYTKQVVQLLDPTYGAGAAGDYGVVIQSLTAGKQVYASRSIFWGGDWEGETLEAGTRTTGKTWYFAEGSRVRSSFFNNYFLIFNPTATAGTVRATFYRSDGVQIVREYAIGATTRLTIDANQVAELQNLDFSTIISSTVDVVAERAMYWGPNWQGGHASMGVTSTSPVWNFAEGAAGDAFDTYYLILNPNATAVTLNVTYFGPKGAILSKAYPIGAGARATIYLNSEIGYGMAVAAQLSTAGGEGVVAERSIYWGRDWVDGSNAVGSTAAAVSWYVPEGLVSPGFDTFVLVGNPNDTPVNFTITVYSATGGLPLSVPYSTAIPAKGRVTIYMNDWLDTQRVSAHFQSFSVLISSTDGVSPLVVEEAMYRKRDDANYWRAGEAMFGIKK